MVIMVLKIKFPPFLEVKVVLNGLIMMLSPVHFNYSPFVIRFDQIIQRLLVNSIMNYFHTPLKML